MSVIFTNKSVKILKLIKWTDLRNILTDCGVFLYRLNDKMYVKFTLNLTDKVLEIEWIFTDLRVKFAIKILKFKDLMWIYRYKFLEKN